MKKKEMIQTIFDEMVNLTGARLPKNKRLAEQRESLDKLEGLYLPDIDKIDPEDDWICKESEFFPIK